MRIASAGLEDWMREHYFSSDIDLGSSGVPCWTLGELRHRLGLGDTLDAIALDDSPTLGDDLLRQAIADRCGDGDPTRVMVTHGSTEAIFLLVNALLSAGDEIIAVEPAYHSLVSVARAIGCTVRDWPIIDDGGVGVDLDALEAMVGPRTAAIVVNFPHNPTGVSVTPSEQDRLIAIARDHGCYLLWDNAFAELVYDRPVLPDASARYERCAATGTMSKAYGLPGARIGWIQSAPALLERLFPLRDALTICVSPLLQRIAAEVLVAADDIVAARLAPAAYNRGLLGSWAEANPDLIEYQAPDGGVTAFPRLRGLTGTEDFCRRLHGEAGVLLIPGSCFGRPDRVRLGFSTAGPAFARGLDLLTEQLRPWGATI
jgi:capreomycidine synthase